MGRGRDLVLLYPGCIAFEVLLAAEILGDVDVATTDGAPHRDASGVRYDPTVSFDEATEKSYRAVLVPGGDPESILGDTAVDRALRAQLDGGATLGGICAGTLVLAKAGLLRGRRITHPYTARYAPPNVVAATESYWAECDVVDEPCVVDGSIVTALPFAYVDFATTVARLAGVLDEATATRLNAYYKGTPPPPPTAVGG